MEPHWVAKKPAKGHTRTLGIWAPKENIEAAQKLAEETRIQREVKRGISRAQREKQETKYREQFAAAVYEHLGFASKHEKLARDIAKGAAEHATQVGSERGFTFTGLSNIVNAAGEVLSLVSPDKEEIIYGEVSLEAARQKHRVFILWRVGDR